MPLGPAACPPLHRTLIAPPPGNDLRIVSQLGRPQPKQAICAETINTLNDALCDFYRKSCPGASDLACAPHQADDSQPTCSNEHEDCVDRVRKAGMRPGNCGGALVTECRQTCMGCCGDSDPRCLGWAFGGECSRNPAFMKEACKGSCRQCEKDKAALQALQQGVGGDAAVSQQVLSRPEQTPAEASTASTATKLSTDYTQLDRLRRHRASSAAGTPTDAHTRPDVQSAGSPAHATAAADAGFSSRGTALDRWERAHPTEVQLGTELAVVLLIGLGALACIIISRRPSFLSSQRREGRRGARTAQPV